MSAHRGEFPVATMARVLGVSKAGSYGWLRRLPSAHAAADEMLMKRVRTIHANAGPPPNSKLKARSRTARTLTLSGLWQAA
jgi:hypothetical protein